MRGHDNKQAEAIEGFNPCPWHRNATLDAIGINSDGEVVVEFFTYVDDSGADQQSYYGTLDHDEIIKI